jgi:dUTP pyrophosphatase
MTVISRQEGWDGYFNPQFKFALQEGLDESFLPTPATNVATGWDVKCAKQMTIKANQYALIPLGLRVISPKGWWLKLNPRSSTFAKRNLHTLYGVIDQDYRGMIYLAAQYCPEYPINNEITLNFGDTIAQLIPAQIMEMKVELISNEEFDELAKSSARGDKGFGSSTVKEFK